MRRAFLSLMAVSLSLIAAGCGSSSSSTSSSPLATELSYLPTGSLFVAAIATDPHGTAVQSLKGLLGAFPLAKIGVGALESSLSSRGVDYQTQVEPLFGNPLLFGALQVSRAAPLSGSTFIAVWVTKSAAKLSALIKGLRGVSAAGRANGATLYRSAKTTVAVDGATVVLGSSPAQVEAALNRHAHGGGMTAGDFTQAMGNLPRNTLVQAVGTLTSVLGSPRAGSARSIPWIGAIRGYAVSLSATRAGLAAHFRLDTSGGALTNAELPIASGAEPPELAGTLPIAVGVRDPAQTIAFVEAVLKSVGPRAYSRFLRRQDAAKRKTGFDLNTFASLLAGNLMLASDGRITMVRAGVSDPPSAARQLAKLAQVAPDLLPTARAVTRRPGGFYEIKNAQGNFVDLGLVGSEFVAGVATPAQLRAFATAPATPVPNAHGSVDFRISLLGLMRLALPKTSGQFNLFPSFLSGLGAITGSATATPDALTGSLGLALK
jgi:hypothetical protein